MPSAYSPAQPDAIRPVRDGLLGGAAILAVAAIASVAVYIVAAQSMKGEIQSNLLALTQSASHLANPGDAPATLTTFKAMAAGNADLADLYTMTQDDGGQIHFAVDTLSEGGEPAAAAGDAYNDASPVLKAAFQARQAMVEDKPYTDKWGTVLSAYAPLTGPDGAFIGMTGVDLKVGQYTARLNRMRGALIIGLLIAAICAAGCGFGVFALRRSMQQAALRARDQADQMTRMEAEQAAREAEADRQAALSRRQAMHDLAESFETSVRTVLTSVVGAAGELRAESEKVSAIADDTRERSEAVSRISHEAAQSSSQVAAASEELTASIGEIRDQTERSSSVVRDATAKGQAATAVIERLSTSSSRIGDVVGVIDDIARQINLLALNATIESARAGEAGKGFAVVASEVKNLSAQVSKALAEISGQIHAIQSETQQSVSAVNDILGVLSAVSDGTVVVATAVSQQSSVTEEISQNIHATAHGAREIAETMSGVLEAAGETGATARRVREATGRLQDQAAALDGAVDGFLKRIRA